jgi:hypothetical protein
MEVENTHIQNKTLESVAHAGRKRPMSCRWRRLRAAYSRLQEIVHEYQSAPEGEDNQIALELVEMKHNIPKAAERRGPGEENGTAAA